LFMTHHKKYWMLPILPVGVPFYDAGGAVHLHPVLI
jgi:hypothetical protein